MQNSYSRHLNSKASICRSVTIIYFGEVVRGWKNRGEYTLVGTSFSVNPRIWAQCRWKFRCRVQEAPNTCYKSCRVNLWLLITNESEPSAQINTNKHGALNYEYWSVGQNARRICAHEKKNDLSRGEVSVFGPPYLHQFTANSVSLFRLSRRCKRCYRYKSYARRSRERMSDCGHEFSFHVFWRGGRLWFGEHPATW